MLIAHLYSMYYIRCTRFTIVVVNSTKSQGINHITQVTYPNLGSKLRWQSFINPCTPWVLVCGPVKNNSIKYDLSHHISHLHDLHPTYFGHGTHTPLTFIN